MPICVPESTLIFNTEREKLHFLIIFSTLRKNQHTNKLKICMNWIIFHPLKFLSNIHAMSERVTLLLPTFAIIIFYYNFASTFEALFSQKFCYYFRGGREIK
jgi:hypothetical protein